MYPLEIKPFFNCKPHEIYNPTELHNRLLQLCTKTKVFFTCAPTHAWQGCRLTFFMCDVGKLGLLGKFMKWYGRQSQKSFSADNTASSPLQSNPKGFPLCLIFSPISIYIIFITLTYPKLVL